VRFTLVLQPGEQDRPPATAFLFRRAAEPPRPRPAEPGTRGSQPARLSLQTTGPSPCHRPCLPAAPPLAGTVAPLLPTRELPLTNHTSSSPPRPPNHLAGKEGLTGELDSSVLRSPPVAERLSRSQSPLPQLQKQQRGKASLGFPRSPKPRGILTGSTEPWSLAAGPGSLGSAPAIAAPCQRSWLPAVRRDGRGDGRSALRSRTGAQCQDAASNEELARNTPVDSPC